VPEVGNIVMHIRVFTLKFNPVLDGFDDSELQSFIRDKDILSVTDHFFVKDGMPYLILVVHFHPEPVETNAKHPKKHARDESWRDLLTEADWPLFNSLRNWRRERANQDGLPPYIICTNRMLAQIVHERPQSLESLGKIHGFGSRKLEKYGRNLLDLMRGKPKRGDDEKG
jgi:ATP-dependent DNA helicase RecQ